MRGEGEVSAVVLTLYCCVPDGGREGGRKGGVGKGRQERQGKKGKEGNEEGSVGWVWRRGRKWKRNEKGLTKEGKGGRVKRRGKKRMRKGIIEGARWIGTKKKGKTEEMGNKERRYKERKSRKKRE